MTAQCPPRPAQDGSPPTRTNGADSVLLAPPAPGLSCVTFHLSGPGTAGGVSGPSVSSESVGGVPSAADCDLGPDLRYQFPQLHPLEAGLPQTGRFLQVFPRERARPVSHWLISSPLRV